MSRTPLAFAAFERLADRYALRVERKAHNAYYDRPAVLSLLPEVRGQRVLDAGCGPGVYSELLADAGADRLLEPLPTEELRELEPKTYAELMAFPGFLTVRALKLQSSTRALE